MPNRPFEAKFSVLIIDDDQVDRQMIQRELGCNFRFHEANNEPRAKTILHSDPPDCVLLDYHIPGTDTLHILETCVQYRIPVVIITGEGDEVVATEALKRGASDYLPKTLVSQSSLTRAITNAIDKSTLKRLLQDKHHELETFVSTAAHDLKAPLRTVVTQCELVARLSEPPLNAEAQTALQTAIASAQDLTQLITSLLAYTEVGRSKTPFECVDLEQMAQQVVASLKTSIKSSSARIDIGPLPTIQGDPTGLRQLFQNLISNALKFQGEDPPQVQLTATQSEPYWEIRVKDNGLGIEPAYHQRIFKPLTRLHTKTSYDGSGLGLAICTKIVHQHGGSIGVESELGQGSVFVFTLPI